MANDFYTKNAKCFYCDICDFTCHKNSDYQRHLSTRKHRIATEPDYDDSTHNKTYKCHCGKIYKQSCSLSKHKQKCSQMIPSVAAAAATTAPTVNIHIVEASVTTAGSTTPSVTNFVPYHTNTITEIPKEMIIELIIQNKELKSMLLEEREERKEELEEMKTLFQENLKQNIVINHTSNMQHNNFNLNFFLNEQCKDAISMMEFIESLQVNTTDVEYTGTHGYVEGITKIFMNGLKQLDVYKRPIHCTDLKRETLYIKEENSWEKDNPDKTKFKNAIKAVVRKNAMQVRKWQEENPRCNIMDSKEFLLHLDIMRQSLGGGNKEITDRNNEKIIKNIAKHVVIDKKITSGLLK
jgi:hypothetical protein